MPINHAAWLVEHRTPLEVKESPYTSPKESQLVIRTHAVAINPVDWGTQLMGDKIFPWMKLPYVLGSDVAGEVVELSPGITNFQIGDRVLGQGLNFQENNPAEGAYQEYVVLWESMVSKIPENIKYEEAAVLPLGLSTAAAGLFQKDYLGIDHPSLNSVSNGKTLLIWGGSTSVGCNAVQLAVAAGYEVVSTSSPKSTLR